MSQASGGTLSSRSTVPRSSRHSTVRAAPPIAMIEKSVPICGLSRSVRPAPTNWAIMICPELEKPRQNIVKKMMIMLPWLTPESPALPT